MTGRNDTFYVNNATKWMLKQALHMGTFIDIYSIATTSLYITVGLDMVSTTVDGNT